MNKQEFELYEKVSDWDFGSFDIETEKLTNWNLYEILKKNTVKGSKVLDLGTGGGEKVLKKMPDYCEIVGTDYSPAMIETAKRNVLKAERKNVTFRLMDNLAMDVAENSFDVVTARNTVTDKKQIYKCLKKGGLLLIKGVDKLDCWDLIKIFKKGQGYNDNEYMSLIDYDEIIDAGFKEVELVPIYTREYFKDRKALEGFLRKVPILNEFSDGSPLDTEQGQKLLDSYIVNNNSDKGILLKRIYYGISARK